MQTFIHRYKKLKDKIWSNWIFFIWIFIIFVVISVFNISSFPQIISYFWKLLWNILPILFLVYIIIFIFSLLLSHKKIIQFLSHWSYIKKTFLAIITWIISSWPIYLWYGFLKKLHNAWLSLGHITGFSYARAIKPPLFAIMIYYFDVKYLLIFIGVLLILSFIQCFLIDFIFKYILK